MLEFLLENLDTDDCLESLWRKIGCLIIFYDVFENWVLEEARCKLAFDNLSIVNIEEVKYSEKVISISLSKIADIFKQVFARNLILCALPEELWNSITLKFLLQFK